MDPDPRWLERFSRQLALSPLGEEGQRALGRSRATVVGAGALGSGSAELLCRMGVGSVAVVDGDVVELSNLHRVRLMGEADVGRPKVEVIAERLGRLVPGCTVKPLCERVTPGTARAVLDGSDVVIDGLDDMNARYVLNDACLELGVPWVYGGVVATGGMVAPFPPGGPCLRCLFPEPPAPGLLPTTETAGVLPSGPAAVAAVQVSHAVRFLVGADVRPSLLAFDLWADEWRSVAIERREGCPACVGGRRDFLGAGP